MNRILAPFVLLALLLNLVSCASWFGLDDPKPAPTPKPVPKENAVPAAMKKKIWILQFNEPDGLDKKFKAHEISALRVGQRFSTRLLEAFNKDSSPYAVDLDSMSKIPDIQGGIINTGDLDEVLKLAAGSNISALLSGTVTSLERVRWNGDRGLFRQMNEDFVVTYKYEFTDTQSKLKLSSGEEKEKLNITGSEVFGLEESDVSKLTSKTDEIFRKASEKLQKKLIPYADALGWSGRIMRMEGNRVYLNSGKRTGILVGDVLKVVDVAREIRDPSSGAVVGFAPGRIKGTVKVIQHFGVDAALGVIQTGAGITVGDRVEPY